MTGLLTARDAIRDFLRKYDEIISPIIRFAASLIVFLSINSMYGYSDLFNRGIVVFLLSVICALTSDVVAVILGGVVILVNALGLSVELGAMFLIVFVLIYCMYMRMFPDCAWILAFVPIMIMLKMYYAVPLIIVIFAGASGIIPTAFGVILYYLSEYTREVRDGNMLEDEDFQVYKYIVDEIINNKTALALIISAAIVILLSSIIYRLPIDYSWYIAIGVGGVCNIIFSIIVNSAVSASISMGTVLAGSLIGIVIALVVQVCKRVADYSHKESVQFEDDDYYYYVKAIPKYNMGKKKQSAVHTEQGRQKTAQTVSQRTKEDDRNR